jgi:hypothetical protein
MKIDPVCKAFIEVSEQPEIIVEEPPNPLERFASDAALAGSLGRSGWGHVEGLRAEMREVETRIAGLHKVTAGADDLDAELSDAGPLEKLSSSSRRRLAYREYLKAAIARGETVAGLVQFARDGGDPDTARLLASIAEEEGL